MGTEGTAVAAAAAEESHGGSPMKGWSKGDRVVQVERLEDRVKRVIAVRAAAEDAQIEIDLRRRAQRQPRH